MDPVGIVLVFTYLAVLNGEGWYGGSYHSWSPSFPDEPSPRGCSVFFHPLSCMDWLLPMDTP